MDAWMIKGPSGNLIPGWSGYTRKSAIGALLRDCDWYSQPTWKRLYRDGFRAVWVAITEAVPNADDTRKGETE